MTHGATITCEEDDLLLGLYAQEQDGEAFEQLARRYAGVVYAAALRQVQDPALAEDITQAVFIVLSRKASKIQHMNTIGGWLLKVTRYCAIDALRKETRHRRHEQLAAEQRPETSEFQSPSPKEWNQLSPVLDEAMATLGSTDRDALFLRYFEDRSYAQIGKKLGTGEEAARKRVSRAVEKLRGVLARRGVMMPAGAIASSVATHAATSTVPSALLNAIVSSSGGSATGLALSIAKGAMKVMAVAKAQVVTLVTCGVAAISIGGGVLIAGLISQRGAPPMPAVVAGDNVGTRPGAAAPTAFAQAAANLPEPSAEVFATPATNPAPATNPLSLAQRVQAVKLDLSQFETSLDAFEIDNGRYPSMIEGFAALMNRPQNATNWHGPYLQVIRNDPWGNAYHYRFPGVHNRNGVDLWSNGPDGRDGTADDIGNWQ